MHTRSRSRSRSRSWVDEEACIICDRLGMYDEEVNSQEILKIPLFNYVSQVR